MRSLRVLQVHNAYRNVGGEDRVVAEEAELLRAHGHEVELYRVDNLTIQGVRRTVGTALRTAYSARARELLTERLTSWRPHIVHVHNLFPLLTASIFDAAIELGTPVVHTLHDYRLTCANGLLFRDGAPCEECIDRSPFRAVLHACYRDSRAASLSAARFVVSAKASVGWQVKRFIALSDFARRVFVRAGFDPEQLVVKPNFVPLEETARATSHPPFALYVGRLSVEKGVCDLVRDWPTRAPTLHVIGDGPLEAELRNTRRANVEIVGRLPRERVAEWMRAASFLVVPSAWYENFPIVVIEAYAAGLPVLAARIGALPELVDEGQTGLLYDPNDPGDLSRSIERLVAGEAHQMSPACRARHRLRYSPEANYSRLVDIYREALSE